MVWELKEKEKREAVGVGEEEGGRSDRIEAELGRGGNAATGVEARVCVPDPP